MSSESNKRRWEKIPKEQRSEIMRDRALFRWFKATPEQRTKQARVMVEGKIRKLKVKSFSKQNVIKINKLT